MFDHNSNNTFFIFEKSINLKKKKKLLLSSLVSLYGISFSTANLLLVKFGINQETPLARINDYKLKALFKFIELYALSPYQLKLIEKYYLFFFFRTLMYKSKRLLRGLPIRGQRTHSNAKRARSLKNQMKIHDLIKSRRLNLVDKIENNNASKKKK